jgi:hypothetical protein
MFGSAFVFASAGEFFDKAFFQGLLGNGIANVLAVILGIPAGLYLHHLVSALGSRHRRDQMRQAMIRAVRHNVGTLATVRDQLEKNAVPTFSLDLVFFDASAQTKYEVFDIDLCASIDHLRFELSHLGRQIDALFTLELDSSARAEGSFVEGRKPSLYSHVHPQLVNSIMVRLPPLEKECRHILEQLGDKPSV